MQRPSRRSPVHLEQLLYSCPRCHVSYCCRLAGDSQRGLSWDAITDHAGCSLSAAQSGGPIMRAFPDVPIMSRIRTVSSLIERPAVPAVGPKLKLDVDPRPKARMRQKLAQSNPVRVLRSCSRPPILVAPPTSSRHQPHHYSTCPLPPPCPLTPRRHARQLSDVGDLPAQSYVRWLRLDHGRPDPHAQDERP